MPPLCFRNGVVFREDWLLPGGAVEVRAGRIYAVHPSGVPPPPDAEVVDLGGGSLAPGFVDLHVHGGGADFMDGTDEAFRTACRAHLRHGTTSLLPTTTVARHERHLDFLDCCRRARDAGTGGARVLGAHFYGPYFYVFGPQDEGEPIVRRDGVGLMPDGTALASGVMGLDHAVRTFHRLTGAPLAEVVRMASLTPVRIAGWESEIGSIAARSR